MIHRTLALALALSVLLFAPSAYALDADPPPEPEYGRSGVYLEVDAQAVLAAFRRGESGSSSGGVTGRAGWRIGSRIAAELHYEWVAKLQKNSANLITVDAKVFILTNRIQPYVRVGAGVIFGNRPEKLEVASSFVSRFGVGVDYWFGEHWATTLFGDFVLPTDHFHNLNYFTAGAGVRYRF